jgi:hypothetical protein
VVVLDGVPRPLLEYEVNSQPVSAQLVTTNVMNSGSHYDYVHISVDDLLYTMEDAFVTKSEATVGELYGDMRLSANELSVRKLTTRLK